MQQKNMGGDLLLQKVGGALLQENMGGALLLGEALVLQENIG